MLTVGDKFPEFALKAARSGDPRAAFETVTNASYAGKWLVVYFWPKDFTFVCPTEIVGFDGLEGEFRDRDAQLLGVSTDSEFVHAAWRRHHDDLAEVKHPWLADLKRELATACGVLDQQEGVALRATFIVDPEPVGRAQPAGGPAHPRRAADRRAVPLQLAEGRADPRRVTRSRTLPSCPLSRG